ncbi:DUF2283 domain-containing protein [Streptomyces sp. NPDC054847]
MVEVDITYDAVANAAYIYLTRAGEHPQSARMYPCDPVAVDGMINLDFDADGVLIGIEVLDARSKLPRHVLDSARRLDAGEV